MSNDNLISNGISSPQRLISQSSLIQPQFNYKNSSTKKMSPNAAQNAGQTFDYSKSEVKRSKPNRVII
jgi:hypothetical protein